VPQGRYKLPAAQPAVENCVAHNGSLIPVPGRDIMVQAWYQGGLSVFDFTDPTKPFAIAYFDRGAINPAELTLGGFWSTSWHNGVIYGSEIGRGLDVLKLTPSALLTQNEIDAAKQVQFATNNPQWQQELTWAPSFAVARAYVDQLERGKGLPAGQLSSINASLGLVEQQAGEARRATLTALAARITPPGCGNGGERHPCPGAGRDGEGTGRLDRLIAVAGEVNGRRCFGIAAHGLGSGWPRMRRC
jgi:hypothetical protein